MIGAADGFGAARKNLVRALRALSVYRKQAVVVVGAQAVYLQCGSDDLPFPALTLDSDIAIDPRVLAEVPQIRRLLEEHGYRLRDGQPGLYHAPVTTELSIAGSAVDILVPQDFAYGKGSRDARLPGDKERAARRTAGLESASYDKDLRTIAFADDVEDTIEAFVAGPAALILAKAEKISERTDERVKAKDAADVFRLLRTYEVTTLQQRFRTLRQVPEITRAFGRGIEAIRQVFVGGSKGRMLFASLLDQESRGELLASYDALVGDLGRAIE